MHVHPLGHCVGPVNPLPPHCPYAEAVPVAVDDVEVVELLDFVVVVKVVDLILLVVIVVAVLEETVVLEPTLDVEVEVELFTAVDEALDAVAVALGKVPLGSP